MEDKKMKYFNFALVILMVFIMNSCSSPYKNLTGFKSFDDLSYTVKKVYLPKSAINIAYTDEGSGTNTIVFIHGLGSYLPAWKKNTEVLKQNYRCIAIDLPGYGKSDKKPHSGQMSYYAAVVTELINELKLENVSLAGHSMGGQISITAAILYPDKIKSIILVDPAGFERFTEGQKQWFRDVMTVEGVKNTTVEAIQNNLASNFYNVPPDAEFMITDRIQMRTAEDFKAYCHTVVQSVNGMVNEPVTDYLNQITQPVLVFFGENDNLIPNRFLNPGFTKTIAQSGADNIKNCKLVMVPESGHFMMFEKPEVFNNQVTEFLK